MKRLHFAIFASTLLFGGLAAIHFSPTVKQWLEQRARDAEIAEWRREAERSDQARARFLALLPGLRVAKVYYIDVGPDSPGAPAPARFHQYKVISASSSISSKASGDLKHSFGRMLATEPEMQAMCFIPHHAVTMTNGRDTYDVLVCFNCGNYEVYSESGDFGGPFSADERGSWDEVFASGGLALPAEARDPDAEPKAGDGV